MILVTGGTGFIGSHLLIELCKNGAKVRGLKRKSSDTDFIQRLLGFYHQEYLFNSIEWADGNLNDTDSLLEAMNGIDVVYHCAGKVSFSDKDALVLKDINIKGTSNIVNAALEAGVKKLCFVSSVAALGNDDIITEDTLWDSTGRHSVYAQSKYMAEQEIWRGMAEGLDCIVVRPSVVLGPWMPDRGMGILFGKIERGLKYYPPGGSAYVDVRDVASAMVKLTDSHVKNEAFIVSSENLSFREFFSLVAETMNVPVPSRCATGFILDLAWRMDVIKAFFTGRDAGFNKETAKISVTTSKYSNKKLLGTLPFKYITMKESIIHLNKFLKYVADEKNTTII